MALNTSVRVRPKTHCLFCNGVEMKDLRFGIIFVAVFALGTLAGILINEFQYYDWGIREAPSTFISWDNKTLVIQKGEYVTYSMDMGEAKVDVSKISPGMSVYITHYPFRGGLLYLLRYPFYDDYDFVVLPWPQ